MIIRPLHGRHVDCEADAITAILEWNSNNAASATERPPMPPSGFGGLSRRRGKKPVIAAVNGLAHGGGCEIVANCDIVLASHNAVFALPEVKRGVVAIAGALPRLTRIVGRMRAMEMALTGRNVPSIEARDWGLCNAVCEEGKSVVDTAVQWAAAISANSPDSVIASKEGIELGWDGISADEGSQRLIDGQWKRMQMKDNMVEGVRAFVEKRSPRWVDSKL